MATDIEKLVVQLSAEFKGFEKSLARQQGVANKQFNAIERRALQMNKNLDGIFSRSFNGLRAGVAGVSAAFGTAELIKLADTWTELKSRVDLASGSIEAGEAVMMRLSEMARRTYSGLEQTAESWLANSTALTELGYSTKEQLDLTETLNNALVISATKGDRARSVMDAWSKAMADGKLQGQNLTTIIQSGGRLAEALAASMGVSTNQLRRLGKEGKITTSVMYGVTSQLEKLRKEADSMPATVGDAIQILKDAMLQWVGGMDQASGMSAALAEKIILLADNFGEVADKVLMFSTIVTSALVGRALGGMIATIPAATTSVLALIAAMRAGALTATGFTAALGPMGLLLGTAAGALYVLSQRQDQADIAAGEHRKAIVLLNQEIADLDYANKSAVNSTRDKIKLDLEAAKVALQRAKAERESARAIIEGQVMGRVRDPELGKKLIEKQMGNSLSLFTKEVDLQEQRLKDFEKSLSTLETNVSNPPTRIKLDGSSDDDTAKKKKPKRERVDDYERLTQSITDRTAALVAETEVQRQLNPLIDDYGYATEKARAEQELLNAAQKADIELTPALRAEIAQTAEQFALATVEAAQLAEAQDKIRQNAQEMIDFQRDLTQGMVDGFLQGKNAAEMFANALGKVADKLIEIGMNSIFDSKGGGLFDALGSLFGGSKDPWSGLRLANGGHVRGAGTSTSDSIPARLSDGEFVVNAKATKQNRALLERINNGQSLALAGGGLATLKAPTMPVLRSPMQSQQQASGVHVTLGWSKDADGNIAPIIESVSQQTFKQGIKQYDKGSAVRTSADLRQVNQRGYGR